MPYDEEQVVSGTVSAACTSLEGNIRPNSAEEKNLVSQLRFTRKTGATVFKAVQKEKCPNGKTIYEIATEKRLTSLAEVMKDNSPSKEQVAAAESAKKAQEQRSKEIMEIWYNLTGDKRDAFMSHMKKYQGPESEDGSGYSEKEYNDLIKLSKQKGISEYVKKDNKGRPEQDLREMELKNKCDEFEFESQPYKRCFKLFKEIVDFKSEEQNEISDAEWDKFQALLKKINSKK